MWHYTIVACCDKVHSFCTPEAKSRVYKTHGPQSQRAIFVLLYLGNTNIPLLEVMLLSSNIITTKYSLFADEQETIPDCSLEPAGVLYTLLEINQHWERSRWCTPVYITFHVTQLPSHVTCDFVAHHVIGSRPIKLHTLLPRYNNDKWSLSNTGLGTGYTCEQCRFQSYFLYNILRYIRAQFHGSAYHKQRIGTYGSREFCAYVKRISQVSGEFWLLRLRTPRN